jgi:DNA-binding transcriptional regulator YiaG
MAEITKPTPAETIALRNEYAQQNGLGITAAQKACAALARVALRTWQQWENGDRTPNLASWELVLLKTGRRTL